MKVEVTVVVEFPEPPYKWNFVAADAMRNIANQIYMNPRAVHDKGESLYYTYEYTVQGKE